MEYSFDFVVDVYSKDLFKNIKQIQNIDTFQCNILIYSFNYLFIFFIILFIYLLRCYVYVKDSPRIIVSSVGGNRSY